MLSFNTYGVLAPHVAFHRAKRGSISAMKSGVIYVNRFSFLRPFSELRVHTWHPSCFTDIHLEIIGVSEHGWRRG